MPTKNHTQRRTALLALISLGIYLVAVVFGELLGFASNSACYPLLGCTSGFFGFDAIEHFLFGITAIWLIIWACERFPEHSILQEKRWKAGFVLIATVALIAVFWEFLEGAHDVIRVDILREPLFSLRFHINLLDQPSNLDTMGDIAFTLVGALVALPLKPGAKKEQ
jgi:hypothetical protein